jgi:thiamine-monophosphate kinase
MNEGLSRPGEFEIIHRLSSKFGTNKFVVLGSGDDAAVVDTPDGDVVVCTDMAIEGVHFRRDWSTAIEIGQRIANQNFADIAAMGAVPIALTVALAVPSDLHVTWLEGFMVGIQTECAPLKVAVVGGDLSKAPVIMMSITALGHRRGVPVVTRATAEPGDVLAVAGRLGYAAAGLACLQRGHRSPREAVDAFLLPQPPLELGPKAAKAGATSMIDVSDGLVQDVRHIAKASGVIIDLDSRSLSPDNFLVMLARNMGESATDWVLTGGEDHALVATFGPRRKLPAGFRPIGQVRAADEWGARVLVDGEAYTRPGGHDHFR